MRRRALLSGLGGLGVAAVAVGTSGGCELLGGSVSPIDAQEFARPLPIPPLAESRNLNGVKEFSLTAQAGRSELRAGVTSETWGFNGSYLGPTLRAERGQQVRVTVANELSETTTLHWHGMHLPAAMDGGPHQPIEPGDSWHPEWVIDQPAATLWYHPHPHGATEKHVYRGLAGLFLLDDDASLVAALPQDYGVDDIPLIVQDKQLGTDGQLELTHDGGEPGMLGHLVLTNGVEGAYLDVTTEQVRLRVLNGSTARSYQFGFDDRPVQLIATDGGFLQGPLEMQQIRVAPGERIEIVVRVTAGERVRLRSYPVELGRVAVPAAMGGNDEFDVVELRAARSLKPGPSLSWPSSAHAEDDQLHESEVTQRRTFELAERKINGKTMDMSRIDETITVGSTEVWEVTNTMTMPHSFHIHDVQFRVLTVDDEPPPDWLAGPKDTVYCEPSRRYRLLMRFEDYTDTSMPYMYHCHMLLHEDEGMMGQFLVVP